MGPYLAQTSMWVRGWVGKGSSMRFTPVMFRAPSPGERFGGWAFGQGAVCGLGPCRERNGTTYLSYSYCAGIRKALPSDLDGLALLLAPLEKAGILVQRSREELADLLPSFTVRAGVC